MRGQPGMRLLLLGCLLTSKLAQNSQPTHNLELMQQWFTCTNAGRSDTFCLLSQHESALPRIQWRLFKQLYMLAVVIGTFCT